MVEIAHVSLCVRRIMLEVTDGGTDGDGDDTSETKLM